MHFIILICKYRKILQLKKHVPGLKRRKLIIKCKKVHIVQKVPNRAKKCKMYKTSEFNMLNFYGLYIRIGLNKDKSFNYMLNKKNKF